MIRSPIIRSQRDQLVSFIDRCARDTSLDIQLVGHLGRYSCVSAAGFVENSLSEVFVDFIRRGTRPQVADYAIRSLRKIQNPKSAKFVEVAKAFDAAVGNALEIYLDKDNQKRKDSIDSIMANRHQIAHGKPSAITLSRVRRYLDDIEEVIVFIERLIY